jgi:thymidylate synthase ThyX
MRHHHSTPFEMCEIKLHVRVPMDAWRQWIRHRTGQESDQARYFTCINSQFDKMLLASTLNDATYAHQTGSSQKLLYADWDERPQIVPSATLMEWSGGKFAPQMLDVESQKMLIEKFHGE